ncbi:MAG: hypothetical protein PUG67_01030 [Peptoniphilaceae bacterium]|nr:hypothetical protein [Peptoniphilaceae bacterium]MDY6018612.1 hypothetical protein [Anaerococcus sp.]
MKTIFYDLKRVKIYLISFIILSFIMISFFWSRDLSNYNVGVFSYYFFAMNYFGMLCIISRLYIEDFQTGAIKNLYVCAGSIKKIISQRLLSSIAIGFVIFLSSQVNVVISYNKLSKIFELNEFIKSSLSMLVVYLLVTILISSYIGLISYAFSNYKRAYIAAILPPALLHYIFPFVLLITSSYADTFLRKTIEYLPNGLIITWANMWNVNLTQFLVFVIWVAIFLLLTMLISSRKDLLR